MSRSSWRLVASSAVIVGGVAAAQAAGLEIQVLSSSPQLVSGNDVLIQLTGVSEPPVVTLNGRTSGQTLGLSGIKSAFKINPDDPAHQVGLISGLQLGPNELTIRSGRNTASITLIDHDINGTLFAGPQDTPFLCELDAHGLKPAVTTQLDPLRADCAAPTQVAYYYRSSADGKWKPFNALAERPTDIDKGANGRPMIIRQERGVINRAAYVISIPHDPGAGPTPTPTDRGGSAWNGKLMYSFGPGARGDGHHQGRGEGQLSGSTQFVGDSNGSLYWYIDHGYAIAAASLNSFGTTTDAVVSAETAYKVKEQFIKEFGQPMFTVGNGVSGGSMQQQIIANAYPGLLDGIVPSNSYSDGMTFFQPLFDCQLLVNVFKEGDWTREQLDAVSGKYWGYCVSNGTRYPGQQADNCDTAVLEMYDKNPAFGKPRCTFADDLKQVFGVDPKTGFARQPWDNVGVQYGLKALNDGVISFAQFIDINKRIGGHDINGNIVAERQVGDVEAIKAAYETGQIDLYNGGNKDIPILSTRYNLDEDPWGRGDANVDVHDRFHSMISRARMEKYNGNSNNYVELLAATIGPGYGPNPSTPGSPFIVSATEGVAMMDKWMTDIANDDSDMSMADKVAHHKPADLVNACWTVDGKAAADKAWADVDPAQRGKVEKITDWAKCNEIFPVHADPRIAAGGPMTDDILKCQLKPIDAADYKTAPNADQTAQLKATFPNGVCDYSKPGAGQDASLTTWAIFNDHGGWETLAVK